MATKSTKTTKTSSNKSKKPTAKPNNVVVEKESVTSKPEVKEPEFNVTVKDIDPHTLVTVKNGYQGRLIYESKKTGELFIWENFGDEQEIELIELKHAKNSSKTFFINNWFMFDDSWVIKYLDVDKYYKYTASIEDIDNLFNKEPKELKAIIADMPQGQKMSIALRASELIRSGSIDSMRTIRAIEEALGMELIEER